MTLLLTSDQRLPPECCGYKCTNARLPLPRIKLGKSSKVAFSSMSLYYFDISGAFFSSGESSLHQQAELVARIFNPEP